jgi:hypothetical protein
VREKETHTHTINQEQGAQSSSHTTHKHAHTQAQAHTIEKLKALYNSIGGIVPNFFVFFLASSSSPYFTTQRLLTKMTKRAVFCFPDLFK